MNKMEKETYRVLANLGWHTEADKETGDLFIWREDGDTKLYSLFNIRPNLDHEQVMSLSASTQSLEFSQIKHQISGGRRYSNAIHEKSFERTSVQIDLEDVASVNEEMIAWWKAQDNQEGIKAFRTDYVPEVTYCQLNYLAALAYFGDFVPLLEYQEAFKKGNHLNFSQDVDIEMLNRAIDIALERS